MSTKHKTSLFNKKIVLQAAADSINKLNPVSLIKNPVIFIVGIGAVPVSYTHLDVYKRQVRVSARDDGIMSMRRCSKRAAALPDRMRAPRGPIIAYWFTIPRDSGRLCQ